jgi:Notch-like protein
MIFFLLAPTPCQPNPCQNGGTCIPQGTSFTCQCPFNYNGYCCENRITTTTPYNPCAQAVCQNGGQCIPTGNSKFLNRRKKFQISLFF